MNNAIDQSVREAEAMAAYLASTDELERVALWAKFLEIHKNRTPAQVAAMEKELGLT